MILIIGFVILKQEERGEGGISAGEKELIETWIIENDLNQYADPKDTVYMGGTPLFDEMTGESIDKYEYILRRHSDRPWLR
ncbi:MAG: hypothetical protein UY15_C0021G0010 [Parcubacteria group bacterium GW2011_GWA2_47_9]|nr:MAG: hypothetical protein UY15_C0021G0010 [Parcubacteria group bacterium GW2011_GWA2_47_9]